MRTRRSRWRERFKFFCADLCGGTGIFLTFVDFTAMADFKYEDNEYVLLEGTKNAVIANTILPKMVELSLESLADSARIVQVGHAFQ